DAALIARVVPERRLQQAFGFVGATQGNQRPRSLERPLSRKTRLWHTIQGRDRFLELPLIDVDWPETKPGDCVAGIDLKRPLNVAERRVEMADVKQDDPMLMPRLGEVRLCRERFAELRKCFAVR